MSTVDALTGQAMVVLQDRPLVALSAWISGAARDCAEAGRALQVVTPLESRVSLPLRTVVAGGGALWIVRHGDGYYEGLTGRPMQWGGEAFVPVPDARDYAPGFTTRLTAPIGAQLGLTYRVRHAAEGHLSGAVDRLLQLLTGKWPAGWGPAEPLEHPWQPDRLTEYARGRSSATIIVAGDGPRPAQAVCEFTTIDGGAVEESTTVTVGYAPEDPPPLAHLPSLVAAMAADQPLATMFVQLTPGRADLTTEARWSGAAAPVALAVAGGVQGPPGVQGSPIGPPRAPMTLFPLGDGRSTDGWQRHRALLAHLG
ncbi:DUF6177 family protein [Actinomadura flavalba]|uniref:DUF6177 family protein n=1 Tax=Actinomadura flavalba TaxID=1120938 RepID=UPI0003A02E3C|nr:DUF6177 family protein [Actinomadura flavalba]